MQRALLIMGLSMLLAQPALAAGMLPPANLLPPGYIPEAAPLPIPTASASDDAERSGMGEADLAQTESPQPAADYVDIPALTPMPQATAPQTPANPAYYTQGITTGPKAYNEGNFTFKAQ